jgi:hypothetical protein
MYDVTVGIYPRERFSVTGRCISALRRNTKPAFKLIIIDCDTPARYRREVDRAVGDLDDVEIIRFDRYVLPNESRNSVVEAAETDYVCLLESDILVQENALQYMLETAKATGAAVVRPTIYQRRGIVHFDRHLGEFTDPVVATGQKGRIGPTTAPEEYEPGSHPRAVSWSEFHCILLRRAAMKDVFPLDPDLSEPEHVDFSLRLRAADASIIYEPRAVVRLVPPPPVERKEREFFRFRWDLEKSRESHQRFRERWNLDYGGVHNWVSTVPARESWLSYVTMRSRSYLARFAPKGRTSKPEGSAQNVP